MLSLLAPSDFSALMAPLGPFEARPQVAVAVSGGADSLCLALLAHGWARELGGRAVALTVDHGLRPHSAAEAARVGDWLRSHGMEHHVLCWEGTKPAADIQAQARAARYGLLEEWCAHHGVLHLLLAHHQDDQAETLLLRLGRGSGVDGLSAMAPVVETFSLRLLRPVLGVPRARLVATLTALGQEWVEDPSNGNPSFARVRLRRMMPALAEEGMSAPRLAQTARRLARARAALEQATAAAAARWVMPHAAGYVMADPAVFRQVPEEIGLRLLARLVQAVAGGEYSPRAERVEAMYDRLCRGLDAAATLGGCRLAPWRGRLLVTREVARMAPAVALSPGRKAMWDGRFRLCVGPGARPGLRLGALGAQGWNRLAAARPAGLRLPDMPAAARSTLPAVYDQQGLCEVPHLGYNREAVSGSALQWIVAAPSVPVTASGRCLV